MALYNCLLYHVVQVLSDDILLINNSAFSNWKFYLKTVMLHLEIPINLNVFLLKNAYICLMNKWALFDWALYKTVLGEMFEWNKQKLAVLYVGQCKMKCKGNDWGRKHIWNHSPTRGRLCDSRLREERISKILKITCGRSWKHIPLHFD